MSAGTLLHHFLHGDAALVTAEDLVPALRKCADAGVRHAVALAPAPEQRPAIRQLLATVPDFRLVGPNCAGVISAATGTSLSTATPLLPELLPGGACLVTQSGGIGVSLLLALLDRGAGFAHFFSTGDELDLGAIRIATELLDEPECTVVGMFLEGLTDPQHLPHLRAAIERTGKPVVAVRCGTSVAGRAAAFGHTGRIVGDATIGRAVLEQAGVHVLDTLAELCDVLTVLSVLPRRTATGEVRVGVVVGAGGAGVIAADEIAHGPSLRLAEPPQDVPSLGDPSVFPRAIHELKERSDVVVAVATTLAHDYELLASADFAGVVFAHVSPAESFTPAQSRRLAARGIPSVPSVQNACRALAIWAGPGEGVVDPTPYARRGLLHSGILGRWLAPTLATGSGDEAVAAASRLGGSVAVKAEGTGVEHRHEVGAVFTHLSTPDEITAAYDAVSQYDDVVVQAMAPRGVEFLVSVVRDPELGPVPVCRTGDGVMSVLSENVPPPLRDLVDEMLEALRADDGLVGIECNPVIVHRGGVTVVDLVTYLR